MSHFTVTVVLPKEGLTKFEDANENTGDDEWHNAYNHQWFHPKLEEALEPYNEQPEENSPYLEKSVELNEMATEVYDTYKNRNWNKLAEIFADVRGSREERLRQTTKSHKNEKTNEWEQNPYTESEIFAELKPMRDLYEIMATEKFSQLHEQGWELFKAEFCYSSEVILEDDEIYDVWWSNPYAKWDWWVVGGRWRSMGDNGLFNDLTEFTATKQIPFWKEEIRHKLRSIEKELDIDRENYTEEEYDKAITEYIESNEIVRFYDSDTKQPKEYYKKEDLLRIVTRRKVSTWAFLFPEEGWIEASEMGWFGMSALDSMDLDEKEQITSDTDSLTDNLINKYKDTHIGLVVDCHI